jgi:hypothetical protein
MERNKAMTRKSLAVIASLGLLVGCDGGLYGGGNGNNNDPDPDGGITVEEPDAGGGGGDENAKPLFDSTVAPLLQAKCSAAACHGGAGTDPLKFLPPNLADYYDVVVSYDDRVVGYFDKTSAPLITMIVPGPHYPGATYTADEQATIEAWLDAELEARSTGEPPPTGEDPPLTPGQASKQLISEWSGCMSLQIWNEENVAGLWANKGSGEGPCIRCHINGQASFIATDQSEDMFNVVVTNKYFMLSYFQADVTDMSNPMMIVNYDNFQRVGDGVFPHTQHPGFNPDGDAMDALIRFYDRTMERKALGQCDPPRLVDP